LSACDVFPSGNSLNFLKEQLLKKNISEYCFVVEKGCGKRYTESLHIAGGSFLQKKFFSPLSQNANCKGFPTFLWLV